MNNIMPITNDLETDYANVTTLAHRKQFAQFFTPVPIAEFMCKWLLENKDLVFVLEPAFGLGVFSRILNYEKYAKPLYIHGYDIDETIVDKANVCFDKHFYTRIDIEDYIFSDWERTYDGIICNPPYLKHNAYDSKVAIKHIEEFTDCKLAGTTNLYALFLLKSITQLNKNGRCAYIIPSEFLSSSYGIAVKKALIDSKTLRHVIIVDHKANVFDDANTTACIILCANDANDKTVQFDYINNISELNYDNITKFPNCLNSTHVSLDTIDPCVKWKQYYQVQNNTKFKYTMYFINGATVSRGIATGNNDFFIFNKSKADLYGIKEDYLLPCITSSKDVRNVCFTRLDFENLLDQDKNVFLLNAKDTNDPNVAEYIKNGELKGIHKGYLTSHRNPWYALEYKKPSPIWVTVFNRTEVRFIRNEANVSNLTTFHSVYPTLASYNNINLLHAYLLTDTARLLLSDNCRDNGNGLQKFEPNDINQSLMIDIYMLPDKSKEEILILYHEYITQPDDDVIKHINKIFLKHFSL